MRAVLALAVAGMVFVPAMAAPAFGAPQRTNRITINYAPPKDPSHQLLYDMLKEFRVLEKLQEFLSPFRLPRMLKVALEGCDGDANAAYENDAITICYEYVDELWKNMPEGNTPAGVTPVDSIVGPLFDTCLHEFGHALFDMLNLPVLGREEDAADQVSAYLMLHLGKGEARRLILGTAYAYKVEVESAPTAPNLEQFADEHGTPAQRMYNLLCLAYGADSKAFGDFVTKGYLPKKRADSCDDEYQQVSQAFETLIGPYVERAVAKKILDRNWLPEATTRVKFRSRPPR